ncbi:MAG: flavodoxin-dependent (E)-4-hydroxy-3-methylbut-2-enyl-diphosphate synthase [Magnetococcales bacterium]|nr:flavodoxin-dependent (E)-4-hydroxy-3-methylbut-2-enyl-diphosphate synthase [Magnetococcales bacterium]
MSRSASLTAQRRLTRSVNVGNIVVGGDAPISVQSMTNTDTRDIAATTRQILELAEAGADLVRVSCPDEEAAINVKQLVENSPVPLIADIHFDHKLALIALDGGIHCLRINPGNIGSKERVAEVVQAASARRVPIRIGVNAGSLDKDLLAKYGEPCADAMVESGLKHIRILEDLNYQEIKISLKASSVAMTVEAYRKLANLVDYPLHLGITEAGGMLPGSVKSAIGLGLLLSEGIGDTLRVSLSANPVEEVRVGFEILKTLGLRTRGVNIISCPTCSRQEFAVIDVVAKLEKRLAHISESVNLSVIGCIVNGPGEAKECHVGLVGGGGENLLYLNGKPFEKVADNNLVSRIVDEVEIAARNIRDREQQEIENS